MRVPTRVFATYRRTFADVAFLLVDAASADISPAPVTTAILIRIDFDAATGADR